MDPKKLIERLHRYSEPVISYKLDSDFAVSVEEAATALSTLRAENDKLRAEVEAVRAERDAAEKEITLLKTIMREKGIFTIPAKYPWEKPEWNL